MKLKLKPAHLEAIESHALRTLPRECCGLLLGRFGENAIVVEEVVESENLLGSPTAFEADPEFVFEAIDRAERSGLELVGIYHSHPNIAAFVSSRDSEIMKLWPGAAWLIISATAGCILERKAYVQKDEKIEELELVV